MGRAGRWAGALLALCLVTGACRQSDDGSSTAGGGDRTDAERAEPAGAVAPIGTYGVGVVDNTFVDDSRPTPSNGSFPGAPNRQLPTRILYPAEGGGADPVEGAAPATDGGPYPLVVFSHGFLASGAVYTGTTQAWVSAGYVVALPTHPLSNTTAPGGPTAADVGEQPGDLSFVIDSVIDWSNEDGSPIEGLVDPERVGAAGHSLGAITTYNFVYGEGADERVEAAIPMSGVAGRDNDLGAIDTPLLILHGDADDTVPYASAPAAFRRASPPKFLVTFLGGGHVVPFVGAGDDPGRATLAAVAVAFLDTYLKDDPSGLDRLRGAVAAQPTAARLQEEPR